MTNPARAAAKYAALFGPCDTREWSLPADVLTARATHARILNAISNYPAPPRDPREQLVVAALTADDPAGLDVGALLDHQRATAERDHRLQVLRTALDRAAEDLTHAVGDGSHEIITEHLTPALTKLWAEITKAVKTLGDLDPADITKMLNAPDKTRQAFLALDFLAARYNRLRQAWSRIPVENCEHDVRGEHSEFEVGIHAVWPDGKRVSHLPAATPPWPTNDGGKGRLIWLVRAGAVPWLPVPAQRDSSWKTANAAAIEAMREQQARHHQTHGWGRKTA
jgi:hypothetical protein